MTAMRAAMWGATLTVWLAAVAFLVRTDGPDRVTQAPPRFARALVERAQEYAGTARLLWLANTLVGLAVLAALVPLGPRLAARLRGPAVLRGVVALLVVLLAVWLARLPLAVVAHRWRRRYGLTDADALHALVVSPWLELVGGAAVACVALAAGMVLARRLGRRWWLAGAPALVAVGAASVLVQPLLLAPKLEPLRDARLAADVRELGDRLGVRVGRVDVERASERTTRANAEVLGLGATHTVVFWDTALDGRLGRPELRFLAAHELAHVRAHHVWKGLAWLALLAFPLVWVVARTVRLEDPGEVPRAVLVVTLLGLAVLPVENAITRRYEAEADWLAVEATRDPAAAEATFRRLVRTNLADPRPPAWVRLVLGTHPPAEERIRRVRSLEAPPAGS